MLDTCTISNLNCLLETSRMFGTIYADPPWKYDNTAARGSAGKHYGCMTVDEICALPIDRLAAPNSHLPESRVCTLASSARTSEREVVGETFSGHTAKHSEDATRPGRLRVKAS
jgi:hypothetical protein